MAEMQVAGSGVHCDMILFAIVIMDMIMFVPVGVRMVMMRMLVPMQAAGGFLHLPIWQPGFRLAVS